MNMTKKTLLPLVAVSIAISGVTLCLLHNARLSTRLSHVEDALRKADESACGVKTEITDKCACAGIAKNDVAIEIERKALYAAYQLEKADFDSSHRMMGGGRISYAMYINAWSDFQNSWERFMTKWFDSTARNDYERKLMKDYGVGIEDLKYSRDELKQAMSSWMSVSSGKGHFENNEVSFTNGVAFFTNAEKSPMELSLRKSQIWSHDGLVFLFASTDEASTDDPEISDYVSSDEHCEQWFLRFRGGVIEDYCHFKHGCDGEVFDCLRYHFEPYNDCIVITSVNTGDIVGELYLGLRECANPKGGKTKYVYFSDSMAAGGREQHGREANASGSEADKVTK